MEEERLQEEPPANQENTWWQNVVLLDQICWTGTHKTTQSTEELPFGRVSVGAFDEFSMLTACQK